MARVLLVEDDDATRRTLANYLRDLGHAVESLSDGLEAERSLGRRDAEVVLLDLGLPGRDGLDLLEAMAGHPEDAPPIVVISARDDMATTIRAMRAGAYEYLQKPVRLGELLRTMNRALEERAIRSKARLPAAEAEGLAEGIPEVDLAGRSAAMHAVFKMIGRVARTRATVLVTGESGTGKERVARAIHRASSLRDGPFHAVNCGALPGGLIESELFGHVRGAFTGSTADKQGRLELAGEGTLLLDEIGELALDLQVKLLRVLQERSFERVGDVHSIDLKARIVATTNRDLGCEVAEGRFRKDLYYRLRVVEIALPPLRKRPEDIPVLVDHLLKGISREIGKEIRHVTPAAMEALGRHGWPGNVRELQNVLLQAATLAHQDVITADLLTEEIRGRGETESPPAPCPSMPPPPPSSPPGPPETGPRPGPPHRLEEVERDHILSVLESTGWQKKRAAEILGISRSRLHRKLRLYGWKPSR